MTQAFYTKIERLVRGEGLEKFSFLGREREDRGEKERKEETKTKEKMRKKGKR